MSKALLERAKGKVGSDVRLSNRKEVLDGLRSTFLSCAEEYSQLSLPNILPVTQTSETRGAGANQQGYDSIVGGYVNHLANKYAITLFPNVPFFNLELDLDARVEIEEAGFEMTEINKLISDGVQRAIKRINARGLRVASIDCMKHLIISGNVLFVDKEGEDYTYVPMNRYWVKRAPDGKLLELMISETKIYGNLPELVQQAIRNKKECKDDEELEMLTWAYYYKDQWWVSQTVEDVLVQSAHYVKRIPWVPLVWNLNYGEHWGRGHIEDNAGDVYAIDFLSEARAEGAAIAADIKFLLRPGSMIDRDEFETSPRGSLLEGEEKDVFALQLSKYMDFTPLTAILQEYSQRLGRAFLVSSAIRRDAERVTAYEVRQDTEELETAHGGNYSRLAEIWQKPIAVSELDTLLAGIDSGEVKLTPEILAGKEALGNLGDIEKLAQLSELMQLPNAWHPELQKMTDMVKFKDFCLAKLGMSGDFFISNKEYAEILKAEQEAARQEKMDEALAKGIGTLAGNPEVVAAAVGGGLENQVLTGAN